MKATKWFITIIASVGAVIHLLYPAITIDLVTIALFLIAVSPWLGTIYKAIELPGGVKIEYHDLEKVKEKAKEAGLLTPEYGTGGGAPVFSFEAISERDPNLALAGLRIEIEKRLNWIAEANGIPQTGGAGSLIPQFESSGLLTKEEASALKDLIGLLNSAVHGAIVDQSAVVWALDIGPGLLRVLEEKSGASG